MDLNHRPLGYEPNELPNCSIPQQKLTIKGRWGIHDRVSEFLSFPILRLLSLPLIFGAPSRNRTACSCLQGKCSTNILKGHRFEKKFDQSAVSLEAK